MNWCAKFVVRKATLQALIAKRPFFFAGMYREQAGWYKSL